MFKLIECNRNYKFVLLRCQSCSESEAFDNDNFESLEPQSVTVKRGVKIICSKCGNSQPIDNRIITLEPQNDLITPAPVHTQKSNLPFWLTRNVTAKELMRTIDFNE